MHLCLDIVEYPQGGTLPLYSLIIGKQTLHDIGAMLDFKEKTITIDEILLLMRNINNLQLKPSISRALKQNSCLAQEQVSTFNATKCAMEILDAKYDKADLPSIVKNNCAHLSTSHCNSLLALLLKFEELFDGMLGDWKLSPVSFELKEGAKPYHGRPYPIPKIHKATFMKEIICLVAIGVLNWQPSSKWVLPSFIIPKKDKTVCTISDFKELLKCIVRKTLSHTQNQYHFAGDGRLHICNDPKLEHGLLHHQVRPISRRDAHYHISLGQILISEIANGICWIS
jgi:hypothetical protein